MRTFLLLFCFLSGFGAMGQASIEINNTSPLSRKEEVVAVPWSQVLTAWPAIDTVSFYVFNAKTGKQVPYQLEYRGMPQVQNLLIQVSVPAKSKLQLLLKKGKPALVAAQTYCRYVPERKDDFAWENNKIGYRMYGKALEQTPKEMAYGVDVWVKRTSRLIINERYKRGEYHVDHGDGLDYYHVGLTLGAGGIAPYKNDTIWYSKNYTQWKVLDNGPLRSTFQLGYDEWNVASQKVNVTKTISLDAGSQLNRVEASFSFDQDSVLPVAVGIIKRNEAGTQLLDEKNGIMAYWEPTHGKDGTTAVACLFARPVQPMLITREQMLAPLTSQPHTPLIYYSGAAWNKAGEITSSEQWFNYLRLYKQKLEQPLRIIVRKA